MNTTKSLNTVEDYRSIAAEMASSEHEAIRKVGGILNSANSVSSANSDISKLNQNVNKQDQRIRKIENVVDTVDSQGTMLREVADRLLSVEQAGVGPSNSGSYAGNGVMLGNSGNSLSNEIKNSNEVQRFIERSTKNAGVQVQTKSILPDFKNNTIISSPATNPEQQIPGVVGGPEQRMWLRQLLPTFIAAGSSYVYTRENVFTNAADAQATEGAEKAESGITFEEVTGTISTYAHWLKMSRQVMSDNQALTGFTQQRLGYGLELKIEDDLINGDGLSGAMSGLLDAGNFTAFTPTVSDSAVDSIRKAKLALENANYQAGLIIVNPSDLADIELLKDVDTNYIIGMPVSGGLSTLWGVPVYSSTAMVAGSFVILDVQQAVTLHLRESTVVEFSDSDDDNFTKNLITMRVEARLGFGVHLPAGVRSGLLVTA